MNEEISSNLFSQKIENSDLSGQLLKGLFGENWQSLIQGVEGGAAGPGASLLLTMLQAVSTIALLIAAIIMTYTVFLGVLGTATEGRPAGKLSTMWVPVRAAVGVGMLIPTAKGLNILMITILTLVGGSINFANYLAGEAYEFLRESGGRLTVTAPPGMRSNAEELAVEALKNLTIQHYMTYKLGQNFDSLYIITEPNEKYRSYNLIFMPPVESSMTSGDLGSITIPCAQGPGSETICKARAAGVVRMIESLVPTAETLAAQVMSEQERQENAVPAPQTISDSAILTAVDQYIQTVAPHIPALTKGTDPKRTEDLNEFIDQAKSDGWLMLGSYYWTISRFTQHQHEISGAMPQVNPANYRRMLENSWDDPAFQALYQNAERRARDQIRASRDAATAGEESVFAKATLLIKKYVFPGLSPVELVADSMKTGDPIAELTNFGHGLVVSSEALGVAALAAGAATSFGEGAAKSPVAQVLTLGGSAGAAESTGFLKSALMLLVSTVTITLFSAGAFLAFYLPALPWLLWMAAVIGWLILIIETLFAAPLWAVGHMLPEGEGVAGQHGRQGYMMLLGVLARPPLMVAGLFSAMILFSLVGNLVGHCFMIFYQSVSGARIAGIVTIIAQILILSSCMIVFAHKIFSLINLLPERVIGWIGQMRQDLGESDDVHRTRGVVMAGGAKIGGGAGRLSDKASEAAGRTKTDEQQDSGKSKNVTQDLV